MAEELKKYLNQLLQRVNGLLCILITDRDGVPLLRVASERAPELSMRPGFLSTFGMATDQASKLGLGRNKTVICMYSNYQVIQMNKQPLVLSFVGTESCNTGHVLSLESQIEPFLEDLRFVVKDS
ncbi:ragulator complex protein LAMTOR3 homolog [Ctenocephalides felis]|uniref:ragulator complex protein LAMTOR3 homolog n=1 Tax=Ctenocephalides felis TaxID=7515 RepID=UPI000E6E169F|nr:ragulator complex protein LAMTOR3 homolog [Ctenocephalides felis]XP_026474509.1 ragulator complex protein LAMTOR3 homolog [Ctenocephalides felis]